MIVSMILLSYNSLITKKLTLSDLSDTIWPDVLSIFAPLMNMDPEEATLTRSASYLVGSR